MIKPKIKKEVFLKKKPVLVNLDLLIIPRLEILVYLLKFLKYIFINLNFVNF